MSPEGRIPVGSEAINGKISVFDHFRCLLFLHFLPGVLAHELSKLLIADLLPCRQFFSSTCAGTGCLLSLLLHLPAQFGLLLCIDDSDGSGQCIVEGDLVVAEAGQIFELKRKAHNLTCNIEAGTDRHPCFGLYGFVGLSHFKLDSLLPGGQFQAVYTPVIFQDVDIALKDIIATASGCHFDFVDTITPVLKITCQFKAVVGKSFGRKGGDGVDYRRLVETLVDIRNRTGIKVFSLLIYGDHLFAQGIGSFIFHYTHRLGSKSNRRIDTLFGQF